MLAAKDTQVKFEKKNWEIIIANLNLKMYTLWDFLKMYSLGQY